MRVEQEQVQVFMDRIGDLTHEKPTAVEQSIANRRYNLIHEELAEYLLANVEGDVVAIADALGDLLYTVLGLACLHGINAAPVFAEVHRSNMTKEPNPSDPIKKCTKGPDYQAPRIADLMLLQTLGEGYGHGV